MICPSTGPMTCHYVKQQLERCMWLVNCITSAFRHLVAVPRLLRGPLTGLGPLPRVKLSVSLRLEMAYDSLAQRH